MIEILPGLYRCIVEQAPVGLKKRSVELIGEIGGFFDRIAFRVLVEDSMAFDSTEIGPGVAPFM